VTAANDAYYQPVLNLLGSLHLNVYNSSCNPSIRSGQQVMVWDIGLKKEQREKIAQLCHVHMHIFNFTQYPAHVADLHTYAFKPILMRATQHHYPSSACLLYLDSGAVLERSWPFLRDDVLPDLDMNGVWFGSSKWVFPNRQYTHPLAFQYFNTSWEDFPPKARKTSRNFTARGLAAEHEKQWPPLGVLHFAEAQAGLVGVKRGAVLAGLLDEWADCALIQACMAPVGTNRSNHRQDQTALNFILYRPPNGYYYKWIRDVLPHLPPLEQWRARRLSRCHSELMWPNDIDVMPPAGFNVHCTPFYHRGIRHNRRATPFIYHKYVLQKP
jgi:hypothetical protein